MNTFFYNFFIEDNKSGHKTKEKYLLDKYADTHEKIIDFSDNDYLRGLSFRELVWHFIYNKKTQPKCLECYKVLKFKRSLREGYGKFCSLSCTNKNNDHIESIKKTNIKKYGGVSPMSSDSVKEKVKNTNLNRYGVDNTWKSVELVSDGFMRNHGVSHVSKVDGVLTKRRQTNIKKYGVLNNLCTDDVLDKTFESRRLDFLSKYTDYDFVNHIGNILIISCNNCGSDYEIDRSLFRYRDSVKVNPCTHCNPISDSVSIQEKELQNFICEIQDNVVLNDRVVINPKELDILIPHKNIAIEFNGLYWHSGLYVDRGYHLNKTKLCNLSGVSLIHVFEDEWLHKKEIVKSIIKKRLGIINEKIYARKCVIRMVKNTVHNKFLDDNHIQGKTGASIKLGLYYNDVLVSLMTFGKLRKVTGSNSVDGEYELIRFCNGLGITVIGGAAKLFKHFIKTYMPKSIISYSDIRYFNGDMYESIGFEFVSTTPPNYFYIVDAVRKHRFNYRKDVLVREGFDKNKSESEIMKERGIPRIYDCGNKKWVWRTDPPLD